MPPIIPTAPAQNAFPRTAASCSTRFSSSASASRRAAMMLRRPWGSSSNRPCSTSIRQSCSAYSGLPPLRASRASYVSAGTADRFRSEATSSVVSLRDNGGSEIVVAPGLAPAQPGRRSSSSGRAVAMTRRGIAPPRPTSSSTKSRSASSAQCKSSKTSTSGRSSASASRNRRQAANISPRRSASAGSAPPRPMRAPRNVATRSASDGSPITRHTVSRSAEAASCAVSLSRIPASPLTISPSAQKVTPSP